jgi:hypothetical protein
MSMDILNSECVVTTLYNPFHSIKHFVFEKERSILHQILGGRANMQGGEKS